jgi:hypothetical protein
MADRDELTESFLALIQEAFGRLMDEPDAHLRVTGFAQGDVPTGERCTVATDLDFTPRPFLTLDLASVGSVT